MLKAPDPAKKESLKDTLGMLVSRRILLRIIFLFGLGLVCLVSVFSYIYMEIETNRYLNSLTLGFLILFAAAPAYLILIYPVAEHRQFPNGPFHWPLLIIVVLMFVFAQLIYHYCDERSANAFVVSILFILTAAQAGALPILLAAPLIMVSSLLVLSSSLDTFGFHYAAYFVCAQLLAMFLFFTFREDIKNQAILELSFAELTATQSILRDIVERDTKIEVARNLHDEIGHLITLIIVNLNRLVKLDKSQSNTLLHETQQLTKTLLQDIRKVVLQLRSDDTVDLNHALAWFKRGLKPLTVDVDFQGFDGVCSPRIGEVVFRACQESITNTIRHSNATRIDIVIAKWEDHLEVTIQDNGKPRDSWQFGNGLNGLKERTEQLLGTFQVESRDDGFRVILKLPG